jgi:hypothetical protein
MLTHVGNKSCLYDWHACMGRMRRDIMLMRLRTVQVALPRLEVYSQALRALDVVEYNETLV